MQQGSINGRMEAIRTLDLSEIASLLDEPDLPEDLRSG
jgi:hypothetical protein